MYKNDIDVVIMWVDGSDKKWIAEKNKYLGNELSRNDIDASANRYRDWDNLQYIFRGIEKNMPWVRKIHFVTNGQLPVWLNLSASKLNFVEHSDFIPQKYLPTFSANPIELNLHRIKDLSEKFIFFNDDFFAISPAKETDFFRNGLPCDQVSLWRALSMSYDDPMPHIMINNAAVINQNFSLMSTIKKHPEQWVSLRNSLINLLLTASLLPISRNRIPALYYHHLPQPFLRSTLEQVWNAEGDILDEVCQNRFRSARDVSQGLMKYWQIMSGDVSPKNIRRMGYYSSLDIDDLHKVNKIIRNRKKKLLCLNDARVEDFEYTKRLILDAFNHILPEKSEFEL
ncbi:MAG: Stealth CR1 domain-containing protein [Candidatus Woesebacteria bacterium]|jgi:hypothetical protein